MNHRKSEELFTEAQKYLVGGVNSPVRAFKAVGGNPLFIDKAKGPYIYDADGNEYIDFVGAFGPQILGHADEDVTNSIRETALKGTSYGASTHLEIELARLIIEAFPSIDKIRFVNSGTEAVMSALRLARGFSKKNKIIKFAGCYHGHSDSLLAQAGSGIATLSIAGSAGVPEAWVADTLIAEYNNIESVNQLFEQFGGEIAAVIVEPVAGNMGLVLPENDFLKELRYLTFKNESLLVFDEVMCGFRERFGGAQHYYDIEPDLTCLGKIIGGGLPVGAYGGKREIMDLLAPLGPVYQAGTLSGNPLAMAAGIATLTKLKNGNLYSALNSQTKRLAEGIYKAAKNAGIDIHVPVFGSMFTPFFTNKKITNYEEAKTCNTQKFADVFWKLIENGMFAPPSQFEAWFVSTKHDESVIEKAIEAFEKSFS